MINSVPNEHWYDFRNKVVCIPLSEFAPSFGMWHIYMLCRLGVDYDGSQFGPAKELLEARNDGSGWLRLNEPNTRIG